MERHSIKVREVEFGKGVSKICVPIVADTEDAILSRTREALEKKPDCIEFRADWFSGGSDTAQVIELLRKLRKILGDTVLLFTFRTVQEGGFTDISIDTYWQLCKEAVLSGLIDLLDVEAFMQEGLLRELCSIAHNNGVFVVASNHNFHHTPSECEMVKKLQYMDQQGADIPKIAVMPETERDVLTLLSATLGYYESGGDKPIITMSMGEIGMISRLAGGIFGSALTFATVGEASAPGQLPIDEVRQVFQSIY